MKKDNKEMYPLSIRSTALQRDLYMKCCNENNVSFSELVHIALSEYAINNKELPEIYQKKAQMLYKIMEKRANDEVLGILTEQLESLKLFQKNIFSMLKSDATDKMLLDAINTRLELILNSPLNSDEVKLIFGRFKFILKRCRVFYLLKRDISITTKLQNTIYYLCINNKDIVIRKNYKSNRIKKIKKMDNPLDYIKDPHRKKKAEEEIKKKKYNIKEKIRKNVEITKTGAKQISYGKLPDEKYTKEELEKYS